MEVALVLGFMSSIGWWAGDKVTERLDALIEQQKEVKEEKVEDDQVKVDTTKILVEQILGE